MNDIAEKLALIVCEQCSRKETESELDFSTRLLSVYNSCHDNIEKLITQERNEQYKQSVNSYLKSSS